MLLFLFGAAAPASSAPSRVATVPVSWVAAVSFFESKCRYWTGDAMLDAAQFRSNLKTLNHENGIVIYRSAGVPPKCVRKARKLAAQAGFTEVRDEVGEVNLRLP